MGSGIRQNLDVDALLEKRTVCGIEVEKKRSGTAFFPDLVKFVCNPLPVDPSLGERKGTGQNSVTT